jgi:endonuclease-3
MAGAASMSRPESARAKRERALVVLEKLRETYPDVRCSLEYRNAFQLLIMTILAAQCTDARVNIVCRDLFKKYKKPADFLAVPIEELEADIQPCGFYRAKAKSITGACRKILDNFGGEVPGTMKELLTLNGVGRKTANVVLGECFNTQGVVVDTHCTRVANRLGFTKNSDPVKIEQDLMKVWPPDSWTLYSHYMVFHGRAICVARAPKCSVCPVRGECPFPDTPAGRAIAR